MFRYFASSPPGCFATWTVRQQDDSPPGRFAPLDVSIPGCFTTPVDVSPPVSKSVVCDTVTSLSSGGETSREVLVSKYPKVRNVQLVNCTGSKASR